jgi:hypothetical protein
MFGPWYAYGQVCEDQIVPSIERDETIGSRKIDPATLLSFGGTLLAQWDLGSKCLIRN